MTRNLILLGFVCLLAGGLLRGQDPIFTQFYAAPLQINPGFAGNSFAPRIAVAFRNQWPGFNNAYRTYAFYYDQSIERLNSGIGFAIEGDDAGDGIYKTSRFSALYSYKLEVTRDLALKLGVEVGALQTSLDWDKLVFPNDIDPKGGITLGNSGETRPENPTNTKLDISTGLLLISPKLWLGLGLKHLNTPGESFLFANDNLSRGLPTRYTLHGGTELTLNAGNKVRPGSFLSPNFLLAAQGPFKQLVVGAYAGVGSIFGGIWYRTTFQNADAMILLVGLREGVFKFGLSYDITVSGLSSRSGGTYELTLGIELDRDEVLQKRRRAARLNDCLGMFR